MPNTFFRMQKVDWPREYEQQRAIIENLSRRLANAESLLAASANLVKALAAQTGIHMAHTLDAGGLKPYITKDQPEMDNTSAAGVWVQELLGSK